MTSGRSDTTAEDRGGADSGLDATPAPLAPGGSQSFFQALAAGSSVSTALGALLDSLAAPAREELTNLLRETRGLWVHQLATQQGTALFCGNALSGAVVVLASLGFHVTVLDSSHERLRLAMRLHEDSVPGSVRGVLGGDGSRLPFESEQFDLAVQEHDPILPERLTELARVARGEALVVLEGRRAQDPRAARALSAWARKSNARERSERPDAALLPGGGAVEQLVALDRSLPRPHAGPRERRALLAGLARRVGQLQRLYPRAEGIWHIDKRSSRASLLERALSSLAQRLDEPRPEPEHVLASCGNTCEVLTTSGAPKAGGAWRLHLPLRPDHRAGLERNHLTLEIVRERFPRLRAPAPLFCGELEGLWLSCERRLPGWPADRCRLGAHALDRLLLQAAAELARLQVRPAQPLESGELESGLERLRASAAPSLSSSAGAETLRRLEHDARALLAGLALPRVLVHGDLRQRHLQVDRSGRLIGLIHWGVSSPEGLPGLDLVHLTVHLRAQRDRSGLDRAWRGLFDRTARTRDERAAWSAYTEALEIDPRAMEAALRLYPLFLATIAYSYAQAAPPGWLERQLGLDRGASLARG